MKNRSLIPSLEENFKKIEKVGSENKESIEDLLEERNEIFRYCPLFEKGITSNKIPPISKWSCKNDFQMKKKEGIELVSVNCNGYNEEKDHGNSRTFVESFEFLNGGEDGYIVYLTTKEVKRKGGSDKDCKQEITINVYDIKMKKVVHKKEFLIFDDFKFGNFKFQFRSIELFKAFPNLSWCYFCVLHFSDEAESNESGVDQEFYSVYIVNLEEAENQFPVRCDISTSTNEKKEAFYMMGRELCMKGDNFVAISSFHIFFFRIEEKSIRNNQILPLKIIENGARMPCGLNFCISFCEKLNCVVVGKRSSGAGDIVELWNAKTYQRQKVVNCSFVKFLPKKVYWVYDEVLEKNGILFSDPCTVFVDQEKSYIRNIVRGKVLDLYNHQYSIMQYNEFYFIWNLFSGKIEIFLSKEEETEKDEKFEEHVFVANKEMFFSKYSTGMLPQISVDNKVRVFSFQDLVTIGERF